MKIRIKSSGGIAGQEEIEIASLDTANLSTTEAEQIIQNVESIFEQGAQVVGADLMNYRIEVEDEQGKRKELVIMDEGEPDSPIQQLLVAITEPQGT